VRVLSVVGARPDLLQLAPVDRALAERPGVDHTIVHACPPDEPGSAALWEELGIPPPRHRLTVGSGSLAAQTATVMARLEPVLAEARPDMVLVYGAGNPTLAAALVAAQLGLRVGHVEAGLPGRVGEDQMLPEAMRRAITDRVSDLLFAPSRDAIDQLRAEGIAEERVHFVGSLTIDSLVWALGQGRRGRRPDSAPYVVTSMHGPLTGDVPDTLREIVGSLGGDLRVVEPLGYIDRVGLVACAALVVTDSSDLQEEASYLGVPCLTVGPGTERPVTCLHGTNRVVLPQRDVILAAGRRALQRRSPARPVIERWDGRAAARVAAVVCDGAHFPADGEPPAAEPPRSARRAMLVPQPANAF
jgi:UDP-N-acetylglucosamine 2-epimerase (non-hydrolysing)